MTKRRPLALGAAAAIGFGSLFIAAPALADEPVQNNDTQEFEAPQGVGELETPEVQSDPAPQDVVGPQAVENAVITSVTEGQVFSVEDAPMSFSGTGDAGDEFVLIVSGEETGYNPVPVTVAEDGTWSADAEYTPVEGLYSVNLGVETEGGGTSYFHTVNYRIGEGTLPLEVSNPGQDVAYYTHEAPRYASGNGEPGAEVALELTSDGGFEYSETVVVEETGSGYWYSQNWVGDGETLPAGAYTLTATQTAGGAAGDPVVVNFTVQEADWTLVTIEGFEEGALYSGAVSTLSGKGEPGATVQVYAELYDPEAEEVTIEQELTATVDENGAWSVALDPAISGTGYVYFNASQYRDAEMTEYLDNTSVYFNLVEAVTIAAPAHGVNYKESEAPTGASGTAPIVLDYDEQAYASKVVATLTTAAGAEEFTAEVGADGTWSVDFGRALVAGEYTLEAKQVFDDAEVQDVNRTAAASSTFTVGNDDPIADTGSDSFVPLAAGAGGLLLAGASTVLIARRRKGAEL